MYRPDEPIVIGPGLDTPLGLGRAWCALEFAVDDFVVLALQVAVATPGELPSERLDVSLDGQALRDAIGEVATAQGGRTHVVRSGKGHLRIEYAATVTVESATAQIQPDEAELDFDDDAIVALRQSRYCPSDALAGFAAAEFAGTRPMAAIPAAVASWVFERFAYRSNSSGPLDTAVDTILANAGVCRDFAHVTIALCRALGIPARLASVYAPGLSPMDFHAVVEVRTGGDWEVVDPTRLAPRSSLIRIATGRDAADTAFATTLAGGVDLISSAVSAVIDGDLPTDDHQATVILG